MGKQDLIDELEQIESIITAEGVMAADKLSVLSKYVETRLKQLSAPSKSEEEE